MAESVSPLRTNSSFRVGLLLAVLLCWVGFSNRCALGLLLSARNAEVVQHECCERSDQQQEHTPGQNRSLECCKAFDALAAGGAKELGIDPSLTLLATVVLAWDLLPPTVQNVRPLETGPPDAATFSELVLHRSLRSHAPPLSA